MNKRTVLVVDDQVINRKILCGLLAADYATAEAENGQAALDYLRENPDVSAVLLDIVMPVMDGYGVLAAMREDEQLSRIPVIVSSQEDGDEAEIRALSMGAQDFIAKPYKKDIILHRLYNTIRLRETAAMVNQAEKDELTGLYNKRTFLQKMREQLAAEPAEKYLLACFGVERFRLVNDAYGLSKGDELLRFLAAIMQEAVPDGLVARFNDDMFFVFTKQRPEYTKAWLDAQLGRVKEFPIDMDVKLHCGLYVIDDAATPADAICERAQLAAKENRGKYDLSVTHYDQSLRQRLVDEQFVIGAMQQALDQGQYVVFYQPKYDLQTEMIIGAEALVRWKHPERGMLSPGLFIPIFEKNGFIAQLDRYVWERACSDMHAWLEKGYPPVAVSVNVSRAEIFNPHLPDILMELLEKYSLPMKQLHLEITESAYTDNPKQIIAAVRKLHDLGFVIEMDDFGSGYSSLNMLAELPVDILKLDMHFIQSEEARDRGSGIIGFVISLARWMRLSVIAEGVETAEQIASLRSMDCNFVQGFYFAKPMDEPSFVHCLCASAVATTVQTKKAEPKPRKSTGAEMLIVDDVETNCTLLSEIFAEDYKIVTAGDGRQAWEYLERSSERVKVMLLDLLMPVMDGFQLLQKLRADERLKDLPVIVTSQGEENFESRALEMKADDFISKPYSPGIVRQRVHNVLAIHQTRAMQQQELSDTRHREQTLLDAIPGGVAIYRVKKSGRIATEYISDGLVRLLGYGQETEGARLKRDARAIMVPEDLPRLEEAIRKSMEMHTSLHELLHLLTREGKPMLVRMDASVAVDKDLRADERAILYAVHTRVPEDGEDALREQSRYRYVLDNLDVAYFELDEDGRFYASDKYSLYAMSDATPSAILTDAGSYSGVHPDDVPTLFDFFRQKRAQLPKVSATLRLLMKDGTYRWTEMLGFYEYDASGARTKSIGVLRDVDQEWLQQNKRLQEALKSAEAANNAKTDFLARVSHDMRTPLNGILGLTELMAGKPAGQPIEHELEELRQSGHYLLNLINDTLDVNCIEHGRLELRPTVCDGKTAFQSVIGMVKPSIDAKGIDFRMTVGALPFTKLYIDVGRVEQAVMNVLSNAIKFTPEGGTIDLEVENVSVKNDVITDRITVRDNGIGMSEEFQKRVFEPFTQEHNDARSGYGGLGLGMTITKECVELMGGSITVSSRPGSGTEVTILLPMPVASAVQVEKWSRSRDEEDTALLRGKRVLLCEDHPLNAEIAIRLLRRKGMLVDHAEDGQVGLERFCASAPFTYDAILMDIRMPRMDGLETTRRIRALDRRDAWLVPIIAMTANALQTDVRQAVDAGMSEHLGKPVEPEKLYHTLARFIRQPNPAAGMKVLVVDDIEMNRAMVKKALNDSYVVLEAENGREALKLLHTVEGIDAVITDVQMPIMDGKELIRAIRADKDLRTLAILANTVYGDHEQEEELLTLGASDFVYKPSSARIIQMRLERLLRNAR